MTPRLRLHTALNVIAIIAWGLLLVERSSWGGNPVSDYGSAAGPVVLFFVLPVAAARAWWRRRLQCDPVTGWERRYLRASTGFLVGTWIASWIPMIFWMGIAAAIASQRWPINLREGPDTAFAREGFEAHFGIPPGRVDGLYYQRGWEFGDGNTHRMKFHFHDPIIIERIVRTAGLDPADAREGPTAWVVESDVPEWWPRQGVSQSVQVFRRHSRPRLWVDHELDTAYYRSWP